MKACTQRQRMAPHPDPLSHLPFEFFATFAFKSRPSLCSLRFE